METPQKMVLPGEVNPVRNSSPAIARLETKRGIRSYPAYRQAGGPDRGRGRQAELF